jgi:hypothetical protein
MDEMGNVVSKSPIPQPAATIPDCESAPVRESSRHQADGADVDDAVPTVETVAATLRTGLSPSGGKAYFALAIGWRVWSALRPFPKRPL